MYRVFFFLLHFLYFSQGPRALERAVGLIYNTTLKNNKGKKNIKVNHLNKFVIFFLLSLSVIATMAVRRLFQSMKVFEEKITLKVDVLQRGFQLLVRDQCWFEK